jgi:adenine/guanine phosphoribosyltransferase-like PRPP-binding protein
VSVNHFKQLIREVPDFPKPGINFYDITTLLKDKAGERCKTWIRPASTAHGPMRI